MQQTIFVSFTNDHQRQLQKIIYFCCVQLIVPMYCRRSYQPVCSQLGTQQVAIVYPSAAVILPQPRNQIKCFKLAMRITILLAIFFYKFYMRGSFPLCATLILCNIQSIGACITLFKFELTLKGGKHWHCTRVFECFFVVIQV